jgi:hypothetical protein
MNDLGGITNILLDPNGDGDLSDRIADDATIEQLIDCLERVLGLQTSGGPLEQQIQ